MKKKKLTIQQVQQNFNRAIVRRDGICRVTDGRTNCKGVYQCSHFFPVGGNSCLRFYPYNAFTQCAGHHLAHHNRDPKFYTVWMQEHYQHELEWMESVRGKSLRYTQPILEQISDLCRNEQLRELAELIRGLLG